MFFENTIILQINFVNLNDRHDDPLLLTMERENLFPEPEDEEIESDQEDAEESESSEDEETDSDDMETETDSDVQEP